MTQRDIERFCLCERSLLLVYLLHAAMAVAEYDDYLIVQDRQKSEKCYR